MKNWKFKYLEKNTQESHAYVFKSLELKNYLQKLINNYNLKTATTKIMVMVNDYNLSFSDSTIYIVISIYKIPKKKPKNESKKLRTKRKNEKLKPEINNFSKKLLTVIKLFFRNKYNIKIRLKNIIPNFKLDQNKEIIKKLSMELRKFQKASFFYVGVRVLFAFISKENSGKLLTNLISKELRLTKQQNFFLSFLKEGLTLMKNKNFSRIEGLKLVIKGRLNNAMRAKTKVVKVGRISLIKPDLNQAYFTETAYEKNGTLGIKLWVSEKSKK